MVADTHPLISILSVPVLIVSITASVAMVVLSLRAIAVEREAGLDLSWRRLAGAGSVAVLVALMSILDIQAMFQTSSAVQESPEVRELQEQRKKLAKQLKGLDASLAKLRKTSPHPELGEVVRTMAIVLTPFLALIEMSLVLLLGDPRTLPLPRWLTQLRQLTRPREEVSREMERLVACVEHGDTRGGLEVAERLNGDLLDRLDWMDWTYLKSYCALVEGWTSSAERTGDRRRELVQSAATGLHELLRVAPQRDEVAYLLGVAQAVLGDHAPALEAFRRARTSLKSPALPFDHNESVCLLNLAQQQLIQGNPEEASRLFDEVTRRKVLVDQIPTTLVRVRLLEARRGLSAGRFAEVEQGVAALRQLEGLTPGHRREVEAICDATEVILALGHDDNDAAVERADVFLRRHLPEALPPVQEDDADEFLESPLKGVPLSLAPQVYRAVLFLKAAALARLAGKRRQRPGADGVATLAAPLLRALQFELRHPEVLAALGGVYAWFVPEKRDKARMWMEAAVVMGVGSPIVRRMLDRFRRADTWRRDALEWFSPHTGRLLSDPTLAEPTRQALIEELAKFQEFRPLLLDLEQIQEIKTQEPTVRLLRDRAQYLDRLAADWGARLSGPATRLESLRAEFRQRVDVLESAARAVIDLERQVVQEIGKTLQL